MKIKLFDKVRKNVRVYGPYLRKDGRKHVIVYTLDFKRTTVSYPKWLMEQYLGRLLLKDETIDHINRDFTDDRISNMQILSLAKHVSIDQPRAVLIIQYCILCGCRLVRRRYNVRGNAKKGKAGPFCRPCAGYYGAELRKNKTKRLQAQSSVNLKYKMINKCPHSPILAGDN